MDLTHKIPLSILRHINKLNNAIYIFEGYNSSAGFTVTMKHLISHQAAILHHRSQEIGPCKLV